jgi:hypothetical protein
MNKTKLSLIVLLLIGSLIATPAFAKGKAKATPVPRTEQDRITAVSADSITIATKNHSKTYAVKSGGFGATEIYVNGQKATIDAVQVGMAASVVAGMDGTTASIINAHAAPTTAPGKK